MRIDKANAIGRAFIGWGGFYQSPANESVAIVTSSTPSTPALSHMSHIQAKFSKLESEASLASEVEEEVEATATSETEAMNPDELLLSEGEETRSDAADDLAEVFADQNTSGELPLSEESSSLPSPASETLQQLHPPVYARSKRRERLLDLARQNATRPLTVKPSKPALDDEQQKLTQEDEKARERMARETIRQRLWKLMGGKIL